MWWTVDTRGVQWTVGLTVDGLVYSGHCTEDTVVYSGKCTVQWILWSDPYVLSQLAECHLHCKCILYIVYCALQTVQFTFLMYNSMYAA